MATARRDWYRKLEIREEASFGRLPFITRGVAAMCLKHADELGRFAVEGDGDIVEAVAYRAGATKADRAQLRVHLPLLLKHGYLRVEGPWLVVSELAEGLAEEDPPTPRKAPAEPNPPPNPSATPPRTLPQPPPHVHRSGEDPVGDPEGFDRSSARNDSGHVSQGEEGEEGKERKEIARVAGAPPADHTPILTNPEPKRSSRAKPAKKLETPIPDGWGPDATAYACGGKLGLSRDDVAEEAEKFRNGALAKGRTYVDWHAAFRTWLGNATTFRAERAGRTKGQAHVELPAAASPEPSRPKILPRPPGVPEGEIYPRRYEVPPLPPGTVVPKTPEAMKEAWRRATENGTTLSGAPLPTEAPPPPFMPKPVPIHYTGSGELLGAVAAGGRGA